MFLHLSALPSFSPDPVLTVEPSSLPKNSVAHPVLECVVFAKSGTWIPAYLARQKKLMFAFGHDLTPKTAGAAGYNMQFRYRVF